MNAPMIADAAARLFSTKVGRSVLDAFDRGTWAASLWKHVVDAGFPSALAAESQGGIGLSWSDAYPILYGLGYWQVPLPLAETMIANLLMAECGAAVTDRPVALVDGNPTLKTSGARLSGQLFDVPWARHCDLILVSLAGADREWMLVELHQDGVSQTERSNHAAEPVDTILLDEVVATRLRASGPGRSLHDLGALAYAAMLCGAVDACIEQSIAYANDRTQFGKTIASNQAIQQQLAHLAGEATGARTSAMLAFQSVGQSSTFDFDIAVAKVRAGEVATLAASTCHQVHGAIGFTQEHTLHFATRRLFAWRARFGSDAYWADRLGAMAIGASGARFWERFTERFASEQTGQHATVPYPWK